jgi:hypothetical protein
LKVAPLGIAFGVRGKETVKDSPFDFWPDQPGCIVVPFIENGKPGEKREIGRGSRSLEVTLDLKFEMLVKYVNEDVQ